jgi:Catalytic LigB subunit of aromatic ring-opening dioxygenase
MAEIIGVGLTHYPGLHMLDEDMSVYLRRTLSGTRIPERVKDPKNWPAEMRAEWADDEGAAAGRAHRERCFAAIRTIRSRLDAFRPDLVLIFGDDQYENFVEDIVPPFCIYIVDEMESLPFDIDPQSTLPRRNIWNEGPQTVFRHQGHPGAARFLANRLAEEGMHLPYAYRLRYRRGLAHAFINTLLFLDVDRKGFSYPVVPFHVNCYGGALVRSRGGAIAPSDIADEPDPPAPSPAACFDVGRAVGRALAKSPWRIALIGSSSWSHAFLTRKNDWLYPDHLSDRARLAELREGRFASWRELTRKQLEAAGQHELLNWIALAGAMSELGKKVEILDYVETYVMNSNKCFAVFER